MPFWRIFYHFVWATVDRQPLIVPDVEPQLYGYIVGKADSLGCITHAIGGVEDHIHVVASIPPKLSLAGYVQHIKGGSAHHLNTNLMKEGVKFNWQRGYGVFSLDSKQVKRVVAYVLNQKQHHQQGDIILALEQEAAEDDGPTVWNNGEGIQGISVIEPNRF